MKHTLARIPLAILCASIHLFAFQLVAAQSVERSQAREITDSYSPESNTCHTTLTFGSGVSMFKICITSHGNLFKLESPASFEHLTPGTDINYGDGYVVCTGLNPAHGFDAGGAEAGWGHPPLPNRAAQTPCH